MDQKKIVVKGARENNLKNVDLELPKEKLIVFTGLSGSGKSTLAFDTIFQEGQRRYVESLSSYARTFLGGIEKPDVDSIEGLSPSIAIDQKTTSHNPRSTVGTVTEIYDFLRLLFGRIGVPYCPKHHNPIISFSSTKMCDIAMSYPIGTKLQILSPIVKLEKGTHKETIDKIKGQGFERVRVDNEMTTLSELGSLEKNKKHSIDLVVSRLIIKDDPSIRSRIFEAIEIALDWSHGYVILLTDNDEKLLSQHHSCPICGFSVPKIEPRLFSFNQPLGYCPDCNGLGIKREVSLSLLIPDQNKSINRGCIMYYKNIVGSTNLEWQEFDYLCKQYKVDMDAPWNELTPYQQQILLRGSDKEFDYTITSSSGNKNRHRGFIEGVAAKIERLYKQTTSDWLREYYGGFMQDHTCTTCGGSRLNEQALSVKVGGKNIYEVTCLPIEELIKYIEGLYKTLDASELEIAKIVLPEILNRAKFLNNVGLGYLTLARMALTLSGGEAQRIRLATQIGSRLSGVLYVLDEPSIGLHQSDNEKLIGTLKDMRDIGNTLIVVEHDEDTMRAADFIVDVGPGAGEHGGEIVVAGSLDDVIKEEKSITGKYLSGEKYIPIPRKRRNGNGKIIQIKGARLNNLQNVSCEIPLGKFIAVTGVSGSGKSSLINETLWKAIKKNLTGEETWPGEHDSIEGLSFIDKVIDVSQDPIGRTPRSNPATYTKVFDEIRDVFAETVEARARGYDKGRFSFNVPGGRCEHCWGDGVVRIPMNFLPDVYVKCEECNGRRYNEETLQCTYKGKNIYDVLEMTVEEALSFFDARPGIKRKIQYLYDVGLGYIKLGQPATTLSGGEAQRVKLATELQRKPTGKTLYILDEPTTGLHTDDIKRLIDVLDRIVDNGDTVLVIEHNLDVIKVADYIIDLGPGGGNRGGKIIATGTPEEVAKNKNSLTGKFLKRIFDSKPHYKD